MYFCRIIQNHIIMNPGKNRCEYLKEIRKRIATENGIPLEQRECTFKGEPELPSEPDTTLTVTDTVPADTVAEIPPPPSWDLENPPVVGMIDEELYAPLEHDHAGTATAYSSLGSGKVITNM